MPTINMRVDEGFEKSTRSLAVRLSELTGRDVPSTEVTKIFAEMMKEGKSVTILPVVVMDKAPTPRGRPPFGLRI